jgi:hypothetical protein
MSILLIWGCGTSHKAISSTPVETQFSHDEVLEGSKNAELDYLNLSIKGDGKFRNKKEKWTFAYKMSIVKDSIIWCSITKFGIEWVRMQITPDSLLILDRSSKSVISTSYDWLQNKTGIQLGFNALEQIMLGNVGYITDSLKADVKGNVAHRYLGRKDSTLIACIISGENFKITRMEAENQQKNQKSFITYANYIKIDEYLMPAYVLLNIIKPERNQIELIHNRMERNIHNINLSFVVPDNYARLQVD